MTTTNHRVWAVITGVWTVLVVAGYLSYLASHGNLAGFATGTIGLAVLLVAMLVARYWLKLRQSRRRDT